MLSKKSKREIKKIKNILNDLVLELHLLQIVPRYFSQVPEELLDRLNGDGKEELQKLFDYERDFKNGIGGNDHETFEQIGVQTRRIISRLKNMYSVNGVRDHDSFLSFGVGSSSSPPSQECMYNLNWCMEQYRDLMFSKLSQSKEEEKSIERQKQKSAERKKKDDADITAFKSALYHERQIRRNEQIQKEMVQKKLNSQVEDVSKKVKNKLNLFNNVLVQEIKNEEDAHSSVVLRFETNINRDHQEHEKAIEQHVNEEKQKRLERKNKEGSLNGQIKSYKQDMKLMESQKVEFVKSVESDNDHIHKLEKEIQQLQEQKNILHEKNRIRKEHLLKHQKKIKSFVMAKIICLTVFRNLQEKKTTKRRRRKTVKKE